MLGMICAGTLPARSTKKSAYARVPLVSLTRFLGSILPISLKWPQEIRLSIKQTIIVLISQDNYCLVRLELSVHTKNTEISALCWSTLDMILPSVGCAYFEPHNKTSLLWMIQILTKIASCIKLRHNSTCIASTLDPISTVYLDCLVLPSKREQLKIIGCERNEKGLLGNERILEIFASLIQFMLASYIM